MNKTFRVQFNRCRNTAVVTSEIGNRIRGGSRKAAVIGAVVLGLGVSGNAEAYFCPSGGTYDEATATCTYEGARDDVTQDWTLDEGNLIVRGGSKTMYNGISLVHSTASKTVTISNSGSGTLTFEGGSGMYAVGLQALSAEGGTSYLINSASGFLNIFGSSSRTDGTTGLDLIASYADFKASKGYVQNTSNGTLTVAGRVSAGMSGIAYGSDCYGYLENTADGIMIIKSGDATQAYGISGIASNAGTGFITNSQQGKLYILGSDASYGIHRFAADASTTGSSAILDNSGYLQMNAKAIYDPTGGTIINRATGRVETESALFFETASSSSEVPAGASVTLRTSVKTDSADSSTGKGYEDASNSITYNGTKTITQSAYSWLSKWTDETVTLTWEDGGTLTFNDIAPDSYAAKSITSAFQSLYGTGTTLKFTGTETGIISVTDDYSVYDSIGAEVTGENSLSIVGKATSAYRVFLDSGNLKISGGDADPGMKIEDPASSYSSSAYLSLEEEDTESQYIETPIVRRLIENKGSGHLELVGGSSEGTSGIYASNLTASDFVTRDAKNYNLDPILSVGFTNASGTLTLRGGSAKSTYALNNDYGASITSDGTVNIVASTVSPALSSINTIVIGSETNHDAVLNILGNAETGIYAIEKPLYQTIRFRWTFFYDEGTFVCNESKCSYASIENYGTVNLNAYAFTIWDDNPFPVIQNYSGSDLRLETANLFDSEVEDAEATYVPLLGDPTGSGVKTVEKNIAYTMKNGWKNALSFSEGSTLTFTDISESETITKAVQDAFGTDVTVQYAGTDPLKTTVSGTATPVPEVTLEKVNALLQDSYYVGKAADADFTAPSDTFTVGSTADDALHDSFGFRSVKSTAIRIQEGKNLILAGNGSTAATGDVTVAKGTLTLGMADSNVANQGGSLQNIAIQDGKLHAPASGAAFTAKTISLESATSELYNETSLTADKISLSAGASITNLGTITTKSLTKEGSGEGAEVRNSGTLVAPEISVSVKNSGTVIAETIATDEPLVVSGTLVAGSLVTYGSVKRARNATIVQGSAAKNDYFLEHPDEAKLFVQAGGTVSQAVLDVIGVQESTGTDNSGSTEQSGGSTTENSSTTTGSGTTESNGSTTENNSTTESNSGSTGSSSTTEGSGTTSGTTSGGNTTDFNGAGDVGMPQTPEIADNNNGGEDLGDGQTETTVTVTPEQSENGATEEIPDNGDEGGYTGEDGLVDTTVTPVTATTSAKSKARARVASASAVTGEQSEEQTAESENKTAAEAESAEDAQNLTTDNEKKEEAADPEKEDTKETESKESTDEKAADDADDEKDAEEPAPVPDPEPEKKTPERVLSREASLASDVYGLASRRAALYEDKAVFGKSGLWLSPDKEKSRFGAYKSDRFGFTVGARHAFNEGRTALGLAAFYSKGKLKGFARDNVEGFGAVLFGAQRFGAGFVAGTASVSRDKTRKQKGTGLNRLSATAASVSAKAGLALGNQYVTVTPYAGVRGIYLKTSRADSAQSAQVTAGAKVLTRIRVGDWKFQPEADVSYARQMKDRVLTLKYDDGNTSVFAGNNAVQANIAASVTRKNVTATLRYTGAAGDKNYRSHTFGAEINYRF